MALTLAEAQDILHCRSCEKTPHAIFACLYFGIRNLGDVIKQAELVSSGQQQACQGFQATSTVKTQAEKL
jgi:hypothetical protein